MARLNGGSRDHIELEHLVDGVMVLDSAGTIVAFSEGAERIIGYGASEVIGRTCQEVFRSDKCEVACPARKTFETGVVLSNCRCHVWTSSGDEIEIAINTSPLKGSDGKIVGAVVVFRNLNEMMEMVIKMTELSREMVREKERSEAIISSIAEGVFTLSTDMTLTSFNPSAERITGYSADEVLGKPCRAVFRSVGCDGLCPIRQMASTGKPVTGVEMEITAKDGTAVPVSLSAALLRDEMGEVIGAVETFRDLSRVRLLTEELKVKYSFRNIIGKSHKMREIYRLIKSVAGANVTVLIQGETGTGKELVARAIHYESQRSDKPFVVVNCAALPETLLESELFGHVRGAFTGATSDRKGRFELADGGTLFLDEISEISQATQVKLLRVLETKQFERVGDSRTTGVNVRLICATNRILKELVQAGGFREDLYYRVNVVGITLPALRERDEDIPLLINHFIERFNSDTGKQVHAVSQEAMDVLIDHAWPGNVRELENAIGHAFVHCNTGTILPQHLPLDIIETTPQITDTAQRMVGSLDDVEKAVIAETLKKCKGNRSKAARRLGIGRSSLWRKIKKYNL
jgi:PAS domain S-box-containing protein